MKDDKIKTFQMMTGQDFVTGVYRKAVIAVGSTEYHGDHLPYGTDSIVASVPFI